MNFPILKPLFVNALRETVGHFDSKLLEINNLELLLPIAVNAF
jgi:hypothetical protein